MRVAIACFSPYLGGMELDAIKYFRLFSSMSPTFLLIKKDSKLSYVVKNQHVGSKNNVLEFSFSSNWSPFFAYNLREEVKKHSIEYIIFFGASELKVIAPAIYGLNVKLIMRHGTTKDDSKKDWFHNKLYKYVDAHVAISQHLASNVEKIFPLQKSQCPKMIYNFVEVNDESIKKSFDVKDKYIHGDNNILELLHVGRIVHGKGQLEAIRSVNELKKNGIAFKLTFVGQVEDGAYHQALLNTLKELDLVNEVIFAGHHQDVTTFYQSSHLFLFPSYGEGLPNAVLEALSHGIPVLAFENTIFPELRLLGLTVHMAKNHDQNCLGLKLLSLAQDIKNQLHNAMKRNGSIITQFFSKESVKNEWLKLLTSLGKFVK